MAMPAQEISGPDKFFFGLLSLRKIRIDRKMIKEKMIRNFNLTNPFGQKFCSYTIETINPFHHTVKIQVKTHHRGEKSENFEPARFYIPSVFKLRLQEGKFTFKNIYTNKLKNQWIICLPTSDKNNFGRGISKKRNKPQ
jgi:hypothetical protein